MTTKRNFLPLMSLAPFVAYKFASDVLRLPPIRVPVESVTSIQQRNSNHTPSVSFVIQLSGEFGNHLMHMAHGLGLVEMAKEYGLEAKLVLKQQGSREGLAHKAEPTREKLQRCFPYFRDFDFSLGNSEEYDFRSSLQTNWTTPLEQKVLEGFSSRDSKEIRLGMRYLGVLARGSSLPVDYSNNNGGDVNITLPMVGVNSMVEQMFVDKYYRRIRRAFAMNERACCRERPHPDETVFHFRNFHDEMKKSVTRLGFEELNPKRIANELFAHLGHGDKMAITSRITGKESIVHEVVHQLEERGIQVRLVESTGPMNDFCFLKSAQKELVGTTRSTFATWAAYLGRANVTRLYTLEQPGFNGFIGKRFRDAQNYTWSNPELKARIRYEFYDWDE